MNKYSTVLHDDLVTASCRMSQNLDCSNVICSSRRPWPTASCSAFSRTSCLQLLQKVVHCLSFKSHY